MPRFVLIFALLMLFASAVRAQDAEKAWTSDTAWLPNVVDEVHQPSSLYASRIEPFDPVVAGCCSMPLLYASPVGPTYVTADFVAFRRDWQSSQAFATAGGPTYEVLGTHSLVFVHQPGLRLLVGRRITPCCALEASFLGLLRWDAVRAVQSTTPNLLGAPGNLMSPFTNFGQPGSASFDFNSFASIRTVSDFNSIEVNLRQILDTRPSPMQASAVFGLRYINIRDQFFYRTESSVVPGGADNQVEVLARNSLVGAQLGGTVEFRIEPRAWLTFDAKALLLRNGASQNTQFTNEPAGGAAVTVTGQHASQRVTLGADLAATLSWMLTPRILIRAGYQAVFLDGLALGSENMIRNIPVIAVDPTELDLDGHLAYHGPFAGLTYTW